MRSIFRDKQFDIDINPVFTGENNDLDGRFNDRYEMLRNQRLWDGTDRSNVWVPSYSHVVSYITRTNLL